MESNKNFGDQITDAIRYAVNSQDFSNLQSTIEQSVNAAAASIGSGLDRANATMRRVQNEQLAEQQRRQQEAQMQALYAKTSGTTAAGALMAVGGGTIAVCSATGALGGVLINLAPLAGTFFACTLGGIVLIVAGAKKIKLAKTFNAYKDIIGVREHCFIKEISARTADTDKHVLKNIKTMMRKGLFKQASLDDNEEFIILNQEGYRQYRQARAQANQRQQQAELASRVSPAAQQPVSLSAQEKDLLSRGEAYVASIRTSNQAISDPEISRILDQIEHVVRTIFQRASEHPEVIDDLGQMMDYYLPTTVKLLDAYRELDAQPVQGPNIVQSKRDIQGALGSLSVAFEKLLDSIFKDVAWDISTDVSVLHTVLAQEGLVNSPFDATSNTGRSNY